MRTSATGAIGFSVTETCEAVCRGTERRPVKVGGLIGAEPRVPPRSRKPMVHRATRSALDLVVPGAADTRQECVQWLASLAKERRLSPKTVEAYGRDL